MDQGHPFFLPDVRGLLAGRVSRQVLLLFALSTLVPLAAMAILSLGQVRGILIEQGEKRLAASAKTYGMAVFERMLLAQDVALAAVARPDSDLPHDLVARRIFSSMSAFDAP